jgi:hypothetical protein
VAGTLVLVVAAEGAWKLGRQSRMVRLHGWLSGRAVVVTPPSGYVGSEREVVDDHGVVVASAVAAP